MLFLFFACMNSQEPDAGTVANDAEQASAASVDTAKAGQEEVDDKVVDVTEISRRSTPDYHADYHVAGMDCRKGERLWSCRSYESHHYVKPEELPDSWTEIPASETWGEFLLAEDLQVLLEAEVVKDKSAKQPERGGRNTLMLSWEGGARSFSGKEATETFAPFLAELNKAEKGLEVIRPRYQLELGRSSRVGLHELAWLDENIALQVHKCGRKIMHLKALRDGVIIGDRKLRNRERVAFEVGGYRVQIDFFYCGRQNYASVTPTKISE